MDTEHMFFCWNILSPGKENYILWPQNTPAREWQGQKTHYSSLFPYLNELSWVSVGKTAYSKRKSCPWNLLLAVAGHRAGIEAHNRSYKVTVNMSDVDWLIAVVLSNRGVFWQIKAKKSQISLIKVIHNKEMHEYFCASKDCLLYFQNSNLASSQKSHLYEDGEYDNSDWSRDKQVLSVDGIRQGEHQGEADCPSQASVGESKLILEIKRDGPEWVDDLAQHQNACKTRRRQILWTTLINRRSFVSV